MARPKRKQMELHKQTRCVAMTGTASFLGQNLLAALADDVGIDRVVAIDLKRPEAAGKKVRFYEIDLTQAAAEARLAEILAAEGASTLVHLAFQASPSHATAYAHELESVGTMHVLVAARQARVRKVVMRSSTLLYGARPSNPNYLAEHQPLRAPKTEPFFADKMQAEVELGRFVERAESGACATVLRLAPLLGPNVENFLTRWLSRRFVMTMMGFDPLIQVLHEADAVAAFKLAIDRDCPGTFNVCADGVLPVSKVIEAAARVALPVPHPIAEPLVALAWVAQLAPAPASFLSYLRFLCVADGAHAREAMGFRPAFTTREAVTAYAEAQHAREGRLLEV